MPLDSSPDVVVTLNRFGDLTPAIRAGAKLGIAEVAFAIEQRAKYHVVENDAVDTGALMNSIYTQADGTDGRDEAIAAATEASLTTGKHSGKPHGAPFEGAPQENTGRGLSAKVGVAAEYGIYVEMGTEHTGQRPFLNPAAQEIRPKAAEIVSTRVAEALKEVAS